MLRLRARREGIFDWKIGFYLTNYDDITKKYLQCAKSFEMVEIPEHSDVGSSFTLPIEEAQILMDELWDCGLRPSEGSGSAGAMKATQNHLEDMRKLVFNKG